MEHENDTEARLTNLEIKATFTEDAVEELSRAVYRQQEQIDRLNRELTVLRQQGPDARAGVTRNASDDLPPHY